LPYANIAQAEAQAPTTMMEYYESIPSKYFIPTIRDFIGKTKAQRNGAFYIDKEEGVPAEVDEKNMYIHVPTADSFGDYDASTSIALFLGPQKTRTVAVESRACGIKCTNKRLYFLRYENQRWKNVTTKVFPGPAQSRLKAAFKKYCAGGAQQQCIKNSFSYEIPQEGTTIRVWSSMNDAVFYKLEWANGRFTGSEVNAS